MDTSQGYQTKATRELVESNARAVTQQAPNTMAVSNILNADELTTGTEVDNSHSPMQVMEAA